MVMHYAGKLNEHGTHRFYWWVAQQEHNVPIWREGRFHFHAGDCGRRRYWQGPHGERQPDWGKRGEFSLKIEWVTLRPKKDGHGWGWLIKWGTNGSETTPDIALYVGRIAAVWIGFGNVIPYHWLERTRVNHAGERVPDWDTRIFGMRAGHNSLDDWYVEWDCWAREGSWSSSDPWWMNKRWNVKQEILGRHDTTREIIAEGTCVVPMPGANYPATYTTTRYVHSYQRPLGRMRDRLLGKREHTLTDITPGKPIPVPGKGENSWDIDDDAIHSMSTRGANVQEAIGRLVGSALATRKRHGGEQMNVDS